MNSVLELRRALHAATDPAVDACDAAAIIASARRKRGRLRAGVLAMTAVALAATAAGTMTGTLTGKSSPTRGMEAAHRTSDADAAVPGVKGPLMARPAGLRTAVFGPETTTQGDVLTLETVGARRDTMDMYLCVQSSSSPDAPDTGCHGVQVAPRPGQIEIHTPDVRRDPFLVFGVAGGLADVGEISMDGGPVPLQTRAVGKDFTMFWAYLPRPASPDHVDKIAVTLRRHDQVVASCGPAMPRACR